MNIPCAHCGMPNSCRQDRHCRRNTGLDPAIKEAKAAIAAMDSATKRLNEAIANLAAAQAVEIAKGQG
jgi:hypothetical protein